MKIKNINEYKLGGLTTLPLATVKEYIPFLQEQLDSIYENNTPVRPWHLCETHNPWSRSAAILDSWKFLDLCQSVELLNAVTDLIGNNIILYDSQFSPALFSQKKSSASWTTDSLRCPVEPLAGLVVRIFFFNKLNENLRFYYHTEKDKNTGNQHYEKSIELKFGLIIFHDINLHYRLEGIGQLIRPVEYVIRYFPATSHYQRDPAKKSHRVLTELYPLLNYAQMPLWLAHGEDKAGNDFITGFQPKAGRWTNPG